MRERRGGVEEVRVKRQLVGGVRRQFFFELEFAQLGGVVQAVLAGGQHVAKTARVVGPVGLDFGGRRRRRRQTHARGYERKRPPIKRPVTARKTFCW